jgi:cobaltochelatase CobN
MKIGALLAPFGPARGIVVGTYGQALEQLRKEGRSLELRIDNLANADQSAADPDPDFMQWLHSDADVVLAHVPPAYDALFEQLQELYQKTGKPVIALSPECAAAAGGVDAQHLRRIWAYQSNGGLENIKNLLGFAAHITGFSPQSVPPPKPMPYCGIYHPDSNTPFDTLEDYLNWRPLQGDSHAVGLFFPRSYWIDGSLDVFDALIRELEGRKVNVIAVFNDKFKGGGDDAAIEKFFMRNGAAVVDTVVFQAYFFLKSSREKSGAGMHQEASDILKRLNVPALLMINSMQTRREYEENPEGLTVPQYIITIALPEFDGISQPVLLGVSEGHIDPATGAQVLRPVPLAEQIPYLAQRVIKWCALRKKPNPRRRSPSSCTTPPAAAAWRQPWGPGSDWTRWRAWRCCYNAWLPRATMWTGCPKAARS